MSKKSGDRKPLPTREEILAFVAREQAVAREAGRAIPTRIGKREIARAFGVKGDDRVALKAVLRALEDDGAVARRRKVFHRVGQPPAALVADIVGRDEDGELVARPVEWDEERNGPAPRIAVTTPRRPQPGRPVAGVGDRALLRVERDELVEGEAPEWRGRVVKLLSKGKARMIGVLRVDAHGHARVTPVDKKALGRELVVGPGGRGEAKDGDLVAVDMLRDGRFGLAHARVVEVLDKIDSEKAISLIALHTHGVPYVFRPDTLAESERVKPVTMKGREDWRALPLVTIDPADAKDHDDAVHAAPDDDPNNPGGFVLTVAIADVAAYVRPGSAMDREALDRGNSVYFPDRVVPMLPERISNDLCSLRAQEDRPALAVRMILDARGAKKSHTFHRVMMRSAARLAYPQAQAAIDGQSDETTAPLLEPVLRPLWAAYAALKHARDERHPLDLDLPERKLLLKRDGTVDRVVTPTRLDAHRLIEECMILANVAAAETLEAHRQPLIYRAHDEPSIEKLNALTEFLSTIGVKLAKGQVMRPRHFNSVLAQAKGTEHENAVSEVVLRTQAQAEYVAENYGHFGLALRRYAHFTSPIRRYADLIVHRALIRTLKLGDDGLPDISIGELGEIAARISAAERRAMAAERETTDRLIASFLASQIGAQFAARISGVTRAGLFVKLLDTGADGFVPAATLGREYYRYDEGAHALIANRSGAMFRLGDIVDVRLVEAAPLAGALRFEMLSDGASSRNGDRRRSPSAKKPAFQRGRSARDKTRSSRN